jgi:hypothetical protein
MKREHVVSLHDNLNRCSAAQRLVAIEITGHLDASDCVSTHITSSPIVVSGTAA